MRGIASLDCEFARYYDVGAGARAADYQRLAADAANACIGGLLFTTDPWQLWDAPFVRQPDLRKAGIMSAGRRGDMDAVVFHSFYGPAMEWLAAHGRRRVAAICASTLSGSRDFVAGIHGQAEQCGLVLPPHWLQFADFSHPAAVRPLVRLLLAGPASGRPQALLVGDDNLTPDVELVLLELGIRVPKELEVVAHCNFPPPALQRLPMRRIGYDLRQLLCDVVAQFRNGRRNGHPEVITVPPLWEDEFAERWAGAVHGGPPNGKP